MKCGAASRCPVGGSTQRCAFDFIHSRAVTATKVFERSQSLFPMSFRSGGSFQLLCVCGFSLAQNKNDALRHFYHSIFSRASSCENSGLQWPFVPVVAQRELGSRAGYQSWKQAYNLADKISISACVSLSDISRSRNG